MNLNLIIHLSICFALLSAADVIAQPTTQPGQRSFASDIYAAMGIPMNGPSNLSILGSIISGPAKERTTIGKPIEELVDSLLLGPPPDEFANLVFSQMTLKDPYGFIAKQDWKYGSPAQRVSIISLLWAQAQAPAGTPQRRAEYARAAAIMAAREPSVFGESRLRGQLYKDPNLFDQIARMTPSQAARLRSVLNLAKVVGNDFGRAQLDVIFAEGAVIKAIKIPGAKIPAADLERVVSGLSRQWTEFAKVPHWFIEDQFDAVQSAWNLRNIAHSQGDHAAQQKADDLLNSWKSPALTISVERWVDEALTTFGEPSLRNRGIGPGTSKD